MKKQKELKTVKEASSEVEKSGVFDVEEQVKNLLPSGCDVFSLACSGKVGGWCYPGLMINVCGESNSGKTILGLTIMAAIYQIFADLFGYDFYDAERALKTINIPNLFGKRFAKALNAYAIKPGRAATIERFHKRVKDSLTVNPNNPVVKPRVIILDSLDNLSCLAELKAMDDAENKKQKPGEKEKDSSGFGMQKAKAGSKYLGKILQYVAETGSIIIVVSQVREKPAQAFMPFADTKTRNGGKALTFYSAIEMWVSKEEMFGKDRKRPIGHITKVIVKRSKLTGKYRICRFPILNAYGIDNTRATIMYLADEGAFKTNVPKDKHVNIQTAKYTLVGFLDETTGKDFTGSLLECSEFVESQLKYEKQLRKLLVETWNDIERKLKLEACGNRRKKFGD
jgi:RecA/RadA recombinase